MTWEKVLIDWCNCLELSKKAGNINDLRDGAFFKELFHVINKSDTTSSENETIKDLISLLNNTYCNCKIECSEVTELTEDELIIFTSLLMHYTCIYDRRDVLTSPLCHKLSTNAQLSIKTLLQMVNTDITHSAIAKMVRFCEKIDEQTTMSAKVAESPLTRIFETPISKSSKIHEKDREISKLKSALELERYEKIDLQEELKSQTEKCKRLENLLNKSNMDMARLRREINTLECRTPPHFRAVDSSDTEKRLKKEIQSLEHYIEKTEKEHEEIRDECYSNRKKLSDLEVEFKKLQNKYLEAEKKNDEFASLTSNQASKISSLEAYCEELSDILDEFRKKPDIDASFIENSIQLRRSLPRTDENLACSVVEVQLKEAHDQNEALLGKIDILNKEFDLNQKKLNLKIEKYENNYLKLYEETRKLDELKLIIVELKFDYKISKEEFFNTLSHLKLNVESIINNYNLSVEKLTSELSIEKENTQNISSKLEEMTLKFEKTIETQKQQMNQNEIEKTKFLSEIASFEQKCCEFSTKIEKLSTDLDISQKHNNEYLSKIQLLENDLKLKISEFEGKRKECEELSAQNEKLSSKLTLSEKAKMKLLTQLQSQETDFNNIIAENNKLMEFSKSERDQLVTEKYQLISELTCSKETISKYSADIEILKETIEENENNFMSEKRKYSNEIENLNAQIKEMKETFNAKEHELNEVIEGKNRIIAELTAECDHLKAAIEKLQSKLRISEDTNEENSAHIQALNETVKQMKNELNLAESEKVKKVQEIDALSTSYDQLMNEKQELTSKLTTAEDLNKKNSAHIESLEKTINEKEKELENLQLDHENLSTQNQELNSKLITAEELNVQMCSKLSDSEENFKERECELNHILNEKIGDIENLTEDCNQLKIENEKLNSKLAITEETNKQFSEIIHTLEETVNLKQNELNIAQSEGIKYSQEIEALSISYEQLKDENQKLIAKLTSSEDINSKYLADIDTLKATINEKEIEINYLRSDHENLSTQNQELNSKLITAEELNVQMCSKLSDSEENFKERECELNHILNEKIGDIENLTKDCNELKIENEKLNSKLSITEETNKQFSEIIHTLEETVNLKQNELNIAQSEGIKYSQEIEALSISYEQLKDENQKLIAKLTSSGDINSKYLADIEDLKETIKEKGIEIDNLRSDYEHLSSQNKELIIKLATAENINVEASLKMKESEEYFKEREDEFNRKMNERNVEVESLKAECDHLKKEIEELNDKLSVFEETNKEQSAHIQKLKETVEQIENESNSVKVKQSQEIEALSASYEQLMDEKQELIEKSTSFEKINAESAADIEILKENIKQKEKEIKNLRSDYEQLSIQSHELISKLSVVEEINEHNKELNETKEKLLIDNKTLKEDYITLIKTIAMYNKELNKVVKNLKKGKENLGSDLSEIQKAYSKFNVLNQIMSPVKGHDAENSDEISKLGEQISKINAYIDVYTEKETFYLKEIDNLKGDLANLNTEYFHLNENMKEQNNDNECQITSLTENLHSVVEKYNQLQCEHRENSNKIGEYESEIKKLKKVHSDLIVKTDLDKVKLQEEILKLEEEILELKRIRENLIEKQEKHKSEKESLNEELNSMKIEYQNKIDLLELEIEKCKKEKVDIEIKLENILSENASLIDNLQREISEKEEEISTLKKKCEEGDYKLVFLNQEKEKTLKSGEEYEEMLANLQVQFVATKLEVSKLEKENQTLIVEKENLWTEMNSLKETKEELDRERKVAEELQKEIAAKEIILQELQDENKKLSLLQTEITNQKFLVEKQDELQQKIDTLMKSNEVQKQTYEFFKLYYKQFKEKFDRIISQKNILETLTSNLRVLTVSINKIDVPESRNLKKLTEKKEAMEIITEDVMKQYNRFSKQINDIIFQIVSYYEKNCDNLLSSLTITQDNQLENYNLDDLYDQASDFIERTADALDQVKTLQKDLDNLNKVEEDIKTHKENVLGTSNKINVEKMKEDELKKKNLLLKQKVTLLDNAKSNLEKTVKKLREENKKLKEDNQSNLPDNDVHYKMLLQEYIAYKDEHEKIIENYKTQLEQLQQECDGYKQNCMRTSTPFGDEHFSLQTESRLLADIQKLQEAYADIRTINERLENENVRSRKIIEDHEQEILKFNQIKEAYDKLLEANNKLMTDVDTIKFKRSRDRDEFVRLLRKEKNESDMKNSKQIQNIKAEYEAKLEKMKDKMIKLYRDEINKEMTKVKAGQNENSSLLKIIEKMRGDLFESEQKIQLLEMERDMHKSKVDYSSPRESLNFDGFDTRSLKDLSSISSFTNSTATRPKASTTASMEFKHPRKVNPSNLDTRKLYEDRRASTLPRTGTVTEEFVASGTTFGVPETIGQNLQMEDEEEMFNNKYLADLKQGNCDLPASGDKVSRVSELAWRNSLVPPHLKSSYPAEMQFCSPGRFKDDDLKASNVQFDDSLSKLLPGDKPRKKDFGTTSYKKPGPPTPSKNGGRLSLQGNEVHPARDQPFEVKRSTPSRIRALFTGRNSSKSSSEVSTPPKRRLNIFRR